MYVCSHVINFVKVSYAFTCMIIIVSWTYGHATLECRNFSSPTCVQWIAVILQHEIQNTKPNLHSLLSCGLKGSYVNFGLITAIHCICTWSYAGHYNRPLVVLLISLYTNYMHGTSLDLTTVLVSTHSGDILINQNP